MIPALHSQADFRCPRRTFISQCPSVSTRLPILLVKRQSPLERQLTDFGSCIGAECLPQHGFCWGDVGILPIRREPIANRKLLARNMGWWVSVQGVAGQGVAGCGPKVSSKCIQSVSKSVIKVFPKVFPKVSSKCFQKCHQSVLKVPIPPG